MQTPSVDFEVATLKNLIIDLRQEGFEPYWTSVGGNGLGILCSYDRHPSDHPRPVHVPGQVTPPETPGDEVREIGNAKTADSLRMSFETQTVSELAEWAAARGRWLYV
jgi:hypothetical protein